jgi:hypothetical protein
MSCDRMPLLWDGFGLKSDCQRNFHIARHSPEPDIVALDGVYAEDKKGCVYFRPAPPPSDAEVARVTERLQRRIGRLLERRGLGPQADRDESDTLRHSQPMLAELYGASVSGCVATGPRAGSRIAKVGDPIDLEGIAVPSGPRCATISGFSVHANVCVPAIEDQELLLDENCLGDNGTDAAPKSRARVAMTWTKRMTRSRIS